MLLLKISGYGRNYRIKNERTEQDISGQVCQNLGGRGKEVGEEIVEIGREKRKKRTLRRVERTIGVVTYDGGNMIKGAAQRIF